MEIEEIKKYKVNDFVFYNNKKYKVIYINIEPESNFKIKLKRKEKVIYIYKWLVHLIENYKKE